MCAGFGLTGCGPTSLAMVYQGLNRTVDKTPHDIIMHAVGISTAERMPTHFQEAAYLYGQLEHQVDISHMPFDKEVVQSYNDFMAFAQQCQGMSEAQMREVFYPRFGNTFYYEYFLVRGQKLY